MKYLFMLLFLPVAYNCFGQNLQSLDTIQPPADYENIYFRPVYSDSLVSSFVIFVKKQVREHKHVTHTEHVYILDGTGEMTLDKKTFPVKKGDVISIPKNTFHSLKTTSVTPIKVFSLQAPVFDGKDRVFAEEKK